MIIETLAGHVVTANLQVLLNETIIPTSVMAVKWVGSYAYWVLP